MKSNFYYKKLIFCLFLVVFSAIGANCQETEVVSQKILKVGYDEDYPPFQFKDENGQPAGFDIDIIKAVSQVMGYQVYFEAGTWFEIKDNLERGTIDVIPGVNINPGRTLNFKVSIPFMVTFHQFFVRKNSGIISLNDFKSRSDIKIVIQNHQVLTEYLNDLNPNQNPSYIESTREGLRMVSSGKYDAMLLPQRCGQYFIQQYYLENLVPITNTILPREYAIGITQNDSLLVADINQGLSIIENTGKFADIYSKWFSQYEEKSFYVKYITWIIGLLLVSGIVIAIILMWNSVLKKKVKQKTKELSLQLKQKEETERQLRIETARAQESDSLKSAFLANMSHEIRTPMNAIIGFSELLAEPDITDHDRAFYFELINANSYALLNLINDIIDVAKIESGQIVIVSNTFDINRLLFELFEVFQMSIKRNDKKKVKLECDPFYTTSYDLFSDEMRLKQVLTNLIGNALKFTDKGFVKFGYDIIEGNLRFFVQDNGIGIPSNKQDVIFNRFRQADEGLARSFGGAGLGLYISKYIVELLGGKIWFESEELSGTTFYFTIPIRVAEPDRKEN